MTSLAKTQHRWDTSTYGEIASARYDRGAFIIVFGNGDRVRLPVSQLQATHLRDPNWPAVRFTPDEIIVPTSTGEVEISWFSLRALTDDEFGAYLDEFAAEEARRADTGASDQSSSRSA